MRISDEVFNKTKNLEELVNKMGTTKDGLKISGVGDYISFKSRLDTFKQVIARDLPELTIDEILKFDSFSHKLRELYGWYGIEYLLSALEYEQRSKKI